MDASKKKIEQIISDGADKLHVLTDFDRTITTNKSRTSWSILSKSGMMPQEYVQRRNELYEKYYPYEIDQTMDRKERQEMLRVWFKAHLDFLIKFKVSREVIKKVVADPGYFELRAGTDKLLKLLNQKKIPVIIISAGVGNFIELLLEHHGLLLPNIHIVSNFVDFDEQGLANSARFDVTIHPANKNEKSLTDLIRPYIEKRPNTILLGDSPDDPDMAAHAPEGETLTIGFFESETEKEREFVKTIEIFKNKYDVVLEGGQGMDYVTDLVSKL